MDAIANYQNLLASANSVMQIINQSEDTRGRLIKSHNYIADYDCLKMAISNRPEAQMFDFAAKEYQSAILALVSGQYRHAFGGLRLFFELMLAAVQFSAHEIDYRMWARNSKDINWGALKNSDNGIFSSEFIRAFNPELADYSKQYLAIAETVYRECSEFVHGNARTHTFLPRDIEFQEDTFSSWNEKAEAMRLVIIFVFSARYLNYLTQDDMHKVEQVIMDALGQLPTIRTIFS